MKAANDSKLDSNEEKSCPPNFNWPHWRLAFFKWLAILSFVLALTLFFFPGLKHRIVIGTILVISPLLVQTGTWIVRVFHVAYERTCCYTRLYREYQNISSELLEMKRYFWYIVENKLRGHMFQIKGAKYHQAKLYISLGGNSSLNLVKGNVVVVIDKVDLTCLGQFTVTEVFNTGYYAVGVKNIDSVWLGYVRAKGETNIMPNIVGIFVPIGDIE